MYTNWPLKPDVLVLLELLINYFMYYYNKEYLLRFRMTIATRGQTVGLDSADNQTNVQVSTTLFEFSSVI